MRATIPALVILYLFIVQFIDSEEFKKKKFISFILILSLIIGSYTPICEIERTIVNTRNGKIKETSNLQGPNFFGYIDGNKFLKYFGKNYNK